MAALKDLPSQMMDDRTSSMWLLWRPKRNRWEYRQLFQTTEELRPTYDDIMNILILAYKQDPHAIVIRKDDLRDQYGDMHSQTYCMAMLRWMYTNGQMRVKDILEEYIYLYK